MASDPTNSPPRARAADASPWNWLLAVPIVIPLLTPLFNRETPTLFGFPAFYWMQLSFVLIGVISTSIVYRMTKRKG
jgi:hypothetical protein